jgi:hypothetical protein
MHWVSLTALDADPDLVGSLGDTRLPDMTWSDQVVEAMLIIHPLVIQRSRDGNSEKLRVVGNLGLYRWLLHLAQLDGVKDRLVLVTEMAEGSPSAETIHIAERLITPLVLGRSTTREGRCTRRQLKKLNDPALMPNQPDNHDLLKPIIKRKP